MLTKVMAKALAPEIAVNAVAPGMIDLGEKSAAAFMRRMAKQTPMQRNGRGDEIAEAVFSSRPRRNLLPARFWPWMEEPGPVDLAVSVFGAGGIDHQLHLRHAVRRESRLAGHVPAPFPRWARCRRNKSCPGSRSCAATGSSAPALFSTLQDFCEMAMTCSGVTLPIFRNVALDHVFRHVSSPCMDCVRFRTP